MKRLFQTRVAFLLCLIPLSIGILLMPSQAGADDPSGFSLTLAGDQVHSDYQYGLGNPVKIIMVLKNTQTWSVITDRGFSQEELQNFLILTAPDGTRFAVSKGEGASDPPPPLFVNNRSTVPAETLPGNWVRSVVIDDVSGLFPVMKTNPGWYTLEAQVPFGRYAWSIQSQQKGLLAIADDPNNWQGTIDSNKIQLYISPEAGGQAHIRVMDRNVSPSMPVAQTQVKVFLKSDIPVNNPDADTWDKIAPVLKGNTDSEGWAVWDTGSPCLAQDEYLAMAYHGGDYGKADIGEDAGWGAGCDNVIEKTIFFGEAQISNTFSVLGLNSVWIRAKAKVFSGNIGVLDASDGPWLSGGVEVFIGPKAVASNGVQILGDSVKIKPKASVFDVFYNDLDNKGTIRGQESTPLGLPLDVYLPDFPEVIPGNDPVKVYPFKTKDLAPGPYGDVRVSAHGTLRFAGGTYHFKSLVLGPKASVVCLASTEIRIEGRLYTGPFAHIGPGGDSGISAKDIILFIKGINGKTGGLRSNPKAAAIGAGNNIKANVYAPNGTLWIRGGTKAEGSFIGNDVIIGIKTKVTLNSNF